jgi:hypothetical protein
LVHLFPSAATYLTLIPARYPLWFLIPDPWFLNPQGGLAELLLFPIWLNHDQSCNLYPYSLTVQFV